jgi:catechol 2,3-dioxygenase-like lactoylglutathione lyase family enzyme
MNPTLWHRPLPAGASILRASCLASFIKAAAITQARVLDVRAIGLTVFDLDRTERFYRDTLDFRTVARRRLEDSSHNALFGLPDRPVDVLTMQLGDQVVEFTQFASPGRPYPADSQSADLWFQHFAIVVSDMDAAYARIRAAGVEPISLNGQCLLQSGAPAAFLS